MRHGDEWATLFRKAGAKYVVPTALRIQPPSNLPQSPAYAFKITGDAQ